MTVSGRYRYWMWPFSCKISQEEDENNLIGNKKEIDEAHWNIKLHSRATQTIYVDIGQRKQAVQMNISLALWENVFFKNESFKME